MKTSRIVAVVLPLVCGANIATAQAILNAMSRQRDNTREFLGLPPLKGHADIPAVSAGTRRLRPAAPPPPHHTR
jgi:hypothetical protein